LHQNQKKQKPFLGRNLQAPIFEMMTVSTIMIAIEGQMSEPKALIIVEEELVQGKEYP
jgi:hypothetical protein